MLSATVEMLLPIHNQLTGDISITIMPGRQDGVFNHQIRRAYGPLWHRGAAYSFWQKHDLHYMDLSP